MVYSIDSMHVNYNGHMYPTQLVQIFSSVSCVQQLIIHERLNQIYIVAHHWKEEILSFPTINVSFMQKNAVGINTISLISMD